MLTDDVRPTARQTVQIVKDLDSCEFSAGAESARSSILLELGPCARLQAHGRLRLAGFELKTSFSQEFHRCVCRRSGDPRSRSDALSLRARRGGRERRRAGQTRRRNSIDKALDFLSSDEPTAAMIAGKVADILSGERQRSEAEFHRHGWHSSPPLQVAGSGARQGASRAALLSSTKTSRKCTTCIATSAC